MNAFSLAQMQIIATFGWALFLWATPTYANDCSMVVLALEAGVGVDASRAKALTDVVSAELSEMSDCSVLSTNDIQKMMEFEAQRQAAGCDDEGCMAEIANALGVDRLVSGDVSKLGHRFLLSLRVANLESTKIERRVSESMSPGSDWVAMTAFATRRLITDDERRIGPRPPEGEDYKEVPTLYRRAGWVSVGLTSTALVVTALSAASVGVVNALLPGMKSERQPNVEWIERIEVNGPRVAATANVGLYLSAGLAVATAGLFLAPASRRVLKSDEELRAMEDGSDEEMKAE